MKFYNTTNNVFLELTIENIKNIIYKSYL